MMNKYQRGRQFEYWCRNWLQKQGYIVHLAGKKAIKLGDKIIFSGNDLFGFADLIAIKPKGDDCPRGEIRLIQVSLHRSKKKREKKVPQIAWPDNCFLELWIKAKSEVVNINRLTDDDFKEIGKIIRGKYYFIDKPED
jgi:hypothetical protein